MTPPVETDQAAEGRQSPARGGGRWLFPFNVEVGDPGVVDNEVERACAEYLIGDVDAVGRLRVVSLGAVRHWGTVCRRNAPVARDQDVPGWVIALCPPPEICRILGVACASVPVVWDTQNPSRIN